VEIGHLVHLRVKSITGDFDPYKEAKRKQNELALRYESTLNVKCPVIAGDIHCNVGDLVLKAQSDHARSHH